jgi:hypothetical protein
MGYAPFVVENVNKSQTNNISDNLLLQIQIKETTKTMFSALYLTDHIIVV